MPSRAAPAASKAAPPSVTVFSSFVDHDGEMELDLEEFITMQPAKLREIHTREEMRAWYGALRADLNVALLTFADGR